jgi:hypothetical protein
MRSVLCIYPPDISHLQKQIRSFSSQAGFDAMFRGTGVSSFSTMILGMAQKK